MFIYLNKYIDAVSVNHPQKAHFVRYAFFGILATVVDLLLFYILIEFLDVNLKLAITTAFVIGVLAHYLFVHAWVYTGPFYGSKTSRYINFFILNVLALLLTINFFRFFITYFHPDTKLMILVIRGLVAVLVGSLCYFINTLHVFKKQ